MAIKINAGRQEVVAAVQSIEFGTGKDIDIQGAFDAIELPSNAIVTGGFLVVNAATSTGATASLGTSSNLTRYLPSTSIAATGLTNLSIDGLEHLSSEKLILTVAGADPTVVGNVDIVLEYVVKGRAEFTQG